MEKKKQKKDSFRGISESFAQHVIDFPVFKVFYKKHLDDVIVGIRDNYINLYHCCNSIAKITDSKKKTSATVSDYYQGNAKHTKMTHISVESNLDDLFKLFTTRSYARDKEEKQSQERLFIDNNKNPNSNWFCIDVEYTKSFASKERAEDWRFDIIAVSKSSPHRVALIELKYGARAIGGKSGVQKHIHDYYKFHKEGSYKLLLPELISIIDGLKLLNVDLPSELSGTLQVSDFAEKPEYYFITLNNNPEGESQNTPKMTMSGYLFTDYKWGCTKISSTTPNKGFYAQILGDTSFKPIFKFSKATLPNIGINDIIDSPSYDNASY